VKIALLFAVFLCIICKPGRTFILLTSRTDDKKYGKLQQELCFSVFYLGA